METCRESAALMLRQFRALLHQQPLPTPAARLLQLTALNMFAVESTLGSSKGKLLVGLTIGFSAAQQDVIGTYFSHSRMQ